MVVLRAVPGADIEMALDVRAKVDEEPVLLQVCVSVTHQKRRMVDAMVTLMSPDLVSIREAARAAGEGRRPLQAVEGIDADFVFELSEGMTPEHIFVALWIGEPYGLVRGYKFVTDPAELMKFADDGGWDAVAAIEQ